MLEKGADVGNEDLSLVGVQAKSKDLVTLLVLECADEDALESCVLVHLINEPSPHLLPFPIRL